MTDLPGVEINEHRARFLSTRLYTETGVHALVDGQFGSTGKGLAASFVAKWFPGMAANISNAGPNSGHTFYANGEKIVLQQLPTYAVALQRFHGNRIPVHLTGGALIDMPQLLQELAAYCDPADVRIHAAAALISETARTKEAGISTGTTGKGVGATVAAKALREAKVYKDQWWDARHTPLDGTIPHYYDSLPSWRDGPMFMEVSQGFSLGPNQGFYPHCTSRECTVAQGLADAGLPPKALTSTTMVVRTFPIRIAGNSGPGYPDQAELTWEEVGQEPEYTTVTKKQRRIFSWSPFQFIEALRANEPDVIFVNFMNYLPGDIEEHEDWLVQNILWGIDAADIPTPEAIFLGYGPNVENVRLWRFGGASV